MALVETVGKLLVEICKLPVDVANGLLEFATTIGMDVPNEARPYAALLVCAFLIGVPFLIDRCRSRTSRVILAYGILCMAFVLLLITKPYTLIAQEFARYRVQGHVIIKVIENDTASETFSPVRWGSDNCEANEDHSNQLCSTTLREITRTAVSTSSANCGSRVVSVDTDPVRKNCVVAKSHLQGCGYDKFPFGVKNCRGRGWIEFAVTAFGSNPVERQVADQPVNDFVSASRPLLIDLSNGGNNSIGPNQRVEFTLKVTSGEETVAELNTAAPSQKDFSANVLPNGKLQISFGKQRP